MFVYVLESLKDQRLYIGISGDPKKRLVEHNAGYQKATKGYRPYKLLFIEECESRIAARTREKFLKSGCGREYIRKLFPCSSVGRASGCE
ncbi:MAG: GIY-YIG nuclease family protein [Candidatus Omnitrophota bacterium]